MKEEGRPWGLTSEPEGPSRGEVETLGVGAQWDLQ